MTRILQVSTNPMLKNTVKTKRKVPDDETGAEAVTTTNNPLVNAAKKAKREAKTGASNKRKLANAEEQPGGLLIVRAPSVPPNAPPNTTTTTTAPPPSTKPPSKKFKSSQPQAPPSSQPPSKSKTQSNPKPTSSLFPSSSQPLPPHTRYNTPDADPALDDAVRAMQDEAAHLRRTSRGPIHDTSSSSLLTSTSTGLNPTFRFPSATEAGDGMETGAGAGAGAGKGKTKRRETIVDTSARLPPEGDETSLIQRNKRLRAGAMAAIGAGMSAGAPAPANANATANANGGIDAMVTPPGAAGGSSRSGGSGSGHRRKSSVGGRGKRISSSFESTGVITQPHPTVADTSFFKHIDADLPDAERVRQLFIWCSARAAASSPSSSSSSSSTPTSTPTSSTPGPSTSSTKDPPPPPPPPLPALSAKAVKALKAAQDDVVRKLAERRVDLSLFGSGTTTTTTTGSGGGGEEEDGVGEKKKANAQNVTNRVWEGVYGGHIRSAMEEEEAWKKVSYVYDTYAKRLRTSLDKRRAALAASMTIPPDGPSTPSAKAQGKQRAHAPTNTPELRDHELPAPFQAGVRMARTVFAQSRARARRRLDAPLPSSSTVTTPGVGLRSTSTSKGTSTRKGADPDSRPLPTGSQSYSYDMDVDVEQETEREVEKERALIAAFQTRMGEVEFKLDHLYVLASQAKAATEVAELMLDRRFEMLGRALDARDALGRASVLGGVEGGAGGAGSGGILGRYVRGTNPSGGAGGRGGGAGGEKADEALRLLRALARVDAARPPAQVGDAARRAVREAQRVGESGGVGVVGERRLTGVPSAGPGVTPRKMPGTPRRGTTPSRERERERER